MKQYSGVGRGDRPATAGSAASGHALYAQDWTKLLRCYRDPDLTRSIFELVVTTLPLVALWSLAWLLFSAGYWWASHLIAIPASGFLLRLFMIQHDCSHGSFFARKQTNDWVGRLIGVATLTPYGYWRQTHAGHHATTGNLDRRGLGDIDTLTVREYLALSRWGRLKYWLYRNPFVLFGLGPCYQFVVRQRLPFGLLRSGWQPWISTQGTNAAIGAVAAFLIWLIGVKAFLLVHMPITLLAATFGVWLFYVQHQFEETSWREDRSWDFHEAALIGSSYYDLPPLLQWFSANIGIHHVHHLSSRIPCYRLNSVLRDYPELRSVSRITLMDGFRSVRLVLWDETQRRLVAFRDVRVAIKAKPVI